MAPNLPEFFHGTFIQISRLIKASLNKTKARIEPNENIPRCWTKCLKGVVVCRPYQSHHRSLFKTLSPVKLVGEPAQRNHGDHNRQRIKSRPEHFAGRGEKTFPRTPHANPTRVNVQEKTVATVYDVTVREHKVLEKVVTIRIFDEDAVHVPFNR